MPNTSALHEHLLSLRVPPLLMPALLFDMYFAYINIRLSPYIAQDLFPTLFFLLFVKPKVTYPTTLPSWLRRSKRSLFGCRPARIIYGASLQVRGLTEDTRLRPVLLLASLETALILLPLEGVVPGLQ